MLRLPRPNRRQILIGASVTLALRALHAVAAPALRLTAEKRVLEVRKKAAPVLGLSNGGTGPMRFTAGGRFAVRLDNRLDEPTLIHWHGLTPPSAQDGMPDLSQPALPPGQKYDYDFPLTRSGSFWMHSHVGFQRSKLLAAPLIIADPADRGRDEQEVVIFLMDFSFRPPEQILADLAGGHGGMAGMDHGHRDHGAMGPMDHDSMAGMDHAPMDHGAMAGMHHRDMDDGAMAGMDHDMAGDMPMGMDINDIDFDAYLANDRTLDDPEVVRVEPGARIRLRLVNGSSATNFWIDLGEISGELIAVDGDAVVPVKDKRFPLAMAQRLDLRLALPPGQGAYPILALREGAVERTGIVLATRQARVRKLAARGEMATRPLNLGLEERLKAAKPLAARDADRTLTADLTGDMMRFVWGINGKRYGEDTPLQVKRGERVALVMRNRTSMAHPMHLHGHHFQVLGVNDRRFSGAMRDTVLVPAGGSVIVAFDADNPGKWAFHCHNEYHMMAGMMTSVWYD